MATMVGTTIEWYDYFIYANAVALVFGEAFFSPVEGSLGTIIAFSTVGISFLFRPLGAVLMGRVGDKYGRRVVLVLTLLLMGAGTTLIGVLPTYATIGVLAPILLVLLRIIQGFSAGGEWGGAALMAVEHAPRNRRGRLGAYPQLGVPAGMLLASGVSALCTFSMTDEQFQSWGWRLPFLLSIVLLAVGHYIRRRVEESPVYLEMEADAAREKAPVSTLLRRHPGKVTQAMLVFMGNNAVGYMLTGGYILGYATAELGLDSTTLLIFITLGSVAWLVSAWFGAVWSDRIGRPRVFAIGYAAMLAWVFPVFLLVETANLALVLLALVVFGAIMGLSYGPLPALYAEHFPARIRFSGASISYALGAILGGAFAPMIAAWLQSTFGSTMAVSTYLAVVVLVSLVAALTFKDRREVDLSHRRDPDEQTTVPEQRVASGAAS
jgi:MFS family permease